jgi:phosphatidylglycerophosphatase A
MPGTYGTLVGLLLYLPLALLPLPAYLLLTLGAIVAGIPICRYGAEQLGRHDHPGIVWDEIAGFLVAMLAVPLSLWSVLAGFALFRLFDILKPWPIGWLDRNVPGGVGMMLDDVLAGAITCGCLHGLLYVGWLL